MTVTGVQTAQVEVEVPNREILSAVHFHLLMKCPRLASYDDHFWNGKTLTAANDFGHHRGGVIVDEIPDPTPTEIRIVQCIETLKQYLK